MMEEVSMLMALDAHAIEQMSEEEIFACLKAEAGPKFAVPTKKAKLKESLLQIMKDKDQDGDAVDKHVKENHRLQQVSLRLEQENDNLAHRLISGKVELRRALDKAEEKVYELTKDLMQTRKELQATEDERVLNEEETAMLKEVFHMELEKVEQRVSRSSGIVEDYKQICSQLTKRLEKQQAAHREELDSFKSAIKSCSRCQHLVDSEAPSTESSETEERGMTEQSVEENEGEQRRRDQVEEEEKEEEDEEEEDEEEDESLEAQIKELEQELAQTKLLMVEANCKIQELEHHKGILANDLHEAQNSWISKAFTSLRASSSGGLDHGVPRDGGPPGGWRRHSTSITGWSSRKLLWPQRNNRKASDPSDS